MSKVKNRSSRLNKKLYLGEFAILGFDFSCKINLDDEAEYEKFFNSFADVADTRNLFVSLDGSESIFEGFVTSGDRYESATEEDRKAIEKALSTATIVSEVVVGDLVDAHYSD